MTIPIYITTNSVGGFPSLHTLSSIYLLFVNFLDDSHLAGVIYHCSFDLLFSNNLWCLASFHVPNDHLYVFFGEMSILIFCPFFDWVVCFEAVKCHELFVNCGD